MGLASGLQGLERFCSSGSAIHNLKARILAPDQLHSTPSGMRLQNARVWTAAGLRLHQEPPRGHSSALFGAEPQLLTMTPQILEPLLQTRVAPSLASPFRGPKPCHTVQSCSCSHDLFMSSRPVPPGDLSHITKFSCRHKILL